MSKSPDLSAFPIPRKGGARPISMDETQDTDVMLQKGGERDRPSQAEQRAAQVHAVDKGRVTHPEPAVKQRALPAITQQAPSSGQVVATTVKLDENRYLRLVNAGHPGPGRLKRRTIQEMMVEAIDEWFDNRGL